MAKFTPMKQFSLTVFLSWMFMLLVPASAFALPALKEANFKAISGNRIQLQLVFSQAIKKTPSSFSMRNPDRIVFDFNGATNGLPQSTQRVDMGNVRQLTAVSANQRIRVIVELQSATPYKTRLDGNYVYVTLENNKRVTKPKVGVDTASRSMPLIKHRVKAIDFRRGDDGSGRVVITLSDPNVGVDVTKQGENVNVELINARLPKRLQRRLDVTDFGTPVQLIKTIQQHGDTVMTVSAKGDYEHLAYQLGNKFIVEIKPMTEAAQRAAKSREPRYSGKRISLDFQDIKVRAVLQLLAEFTQTNIVVSDAVTGSVTLHLSEVPWDQALDIILKTQGLDKRTVGNVTLIAPIQEIAAREKQELETEQQVEELAPMHSELIQVNYAKAAEVAALLKSKDSSLLSERGTVSVDLRTNTLWVRDTAAKLREIRQLIHKLDVPVKQVLIESRIVIIDKSAEKDLGIRWGLTDTGANGTISGTLQGANTIAANAGDPFSVLSVDNRLNVNLPATPVIDADPATLGLAVGQIGDVLIDLELSALESEGGSETLSSPRLVTADGQPAYIEQGEEIPYQEATSSGATSVSFKKVVLSLKVTPQITPDNKIIMQIKVNNDKPSSKEVLGVPAIITREMETQVLVNNGETIVLGGIYEKGSSDQVIRVPFLGSLPWIGALFRSTQKTSFQKELLIFITPKIVQQGMTV